MKMSCCAVVGVLVLVGCRNELERFGYAGRDLEEEGELLPLVSGNAVTNMVPARLLSVYETYEYTDRERAAIACLGLVQPCEPLAEIPAGYVTRTAEPWFTFWVKETEVFGEKGTVGFMAHFNPDRKVWETGETFFSTYHKTTEEARAAFARREKALVKACRPLKLHRLPNDLVIAEFRRLRVISIVGCRADGVITCMTSVIDKCREGCGPWMPLDEQREALVDYRHAKLRAAWRAACVRLADENHEEIKKLVAERGLALFGPEVAPPKWSRTGASRYAAMSEEEFRLERGDPRLEQVFDERLRKTAEGFGVRFAEGAVTNRASETCVDYSAEGSGDLFDVRLGVSVSDGGCGEECEESATNALRVSVSVLAAERLIGGRVVPKEPKRPEL